MDSITKGTATFYQYKLILKINISTNLLRVYLTVPLLCIVIETLFISWWSLFLFILAAPVIYWIHYVISRSVLLISGHPIAKRWRPSITPPWIGYMPEQYISYRLFRKLQLHIFWIGLCVTALFIFWSPFAFTLSLIICHVWMLIPRLYILMRLKRPSPEGMLKFSAADASYYTQ